MTAVRQIAPEMTEVTSVRRIAPEEAKVTSERRIAPGMVHQKRIAFA